MSSRVQLVPNRKFVTPIDGTQFTGTTATTTSSVTATHSFNKMLLSIDCDVTGTVTSLDIYVQFSNTNAAAGFHTYETGAFGSLRVATTSTDFCISGDVMDNYTRVMAVAAGCSATAYYSLTVDITFQS